MNKESVTKEEALEYVEVIISEAKEECDGRTPVMYAMVRDYIENSSPVIASDLTEDKIRIISARATIDQLNTIIKANEKEIKELKQQLNQQ